MKKNYFKLLCIFFLVLCIKQTNAQKFPTQFVYGGGNAAMDGNLNGGAAGSDPAGLNTISFLAELGNASFDRLYKPEAGDLDNDGDLDIILGTRGGRFFYLQNQGTPTAPNWVKTPLASIDAINLVGSNSPSLFNECFPELADIDDDGDLDLLIAARYGSTHEDYSHTDGSVNTLINDLVLYRNIGTVSTPNFVREGLTVKNPDGSFTTGFSGSFAEFAAPALVDIDGDDDLDILTHGSDSIAYAENIGDKMSFDFIRRISSAQPGGTSPFPKGTVTDALTAGGEFIDVDEDGDLDWFFGNDGGRIEWMENKGTATAPVFNAVDIEEHPTLITFDFGGFLGIDINDFNNDGVYDIIGGNFSPVGLGWLKGVPTNPILTTTDASTITVSSATIGGELTTLNGTVTERGFVYAPTATNTSPQIGGTGVVKIVVAGTGLGVFDTSITSLSESTEYAFASYAINDQGTGYGPVKTFTTLDTTAPAFENSKPVATSIGQTGFTLETDIDEAGTIYYVVVADGATAPTSAEVKAGTGSGGSGELASGNAAVTTGDFTNDFNITGLTVNIAYDVYVVAEDDAGVPNIQTSPIQIDVTTVNAAPTFTSSPVTSVDPGNAYTYGLMTSDADGDGVGITSSSLPSWLSLSEVPIVTTFAGTGSPGSANGTGTAASFNFPAGMVFDNAGNLYVADLENNLIRKITPAGVVTSFAGTGSPGSVNGTGTAASFNGPISLTIDNADNLYVADRDNYLIRKITPAGVVTTLAGSGSIGSADGTGTAASFSSPNSITIDSGGNLFVADASSNRIRKITPAGVVTTFAGDGTRGNADGIGTAASFFLPWGVAVDNADNVLVADRLNHSIRKITPAGVVTTFAGGSAGSADGTGIAASFFGPTDVTVDNLGNLFVVDRSNDLIRKITSAGVVTTYAGSGDSGTTDGAGPNASFTDLFGIAVDNAGNLFVSHAAEEGLIRKIGAPQLTLFGNPTGTEVGTHNITLTANDGNGGTVQQSFAITVNDKIPPVFENSTPTSSNIGTQTFTLSTDIDEAGTLYYVVVADGATAPTAVEVKAGTASGGVAAVTSGNQAVTSGDFTHDFSVSGLALNTAYDVYVVAEDDETSPNLQTSPTKIDVMTSSSVSFSVDDPTVVEGNTGNTILTFTVSLDQGAPVGGATVDFATSDGTAEAGSDYTTASGTLSFAEGELSKTIDVTVSGEMTVEVNETITITLTNATGTDIILGDATGTGTITNDDTTVVTIADVMANENAGAQVITATLTNPVQGGFAFDVFTTDGTATTADSDYSSTAGSTLTFTGTAGETQTLNLQGLGDTKVESDETFTMSMRNVGFTSVNTSDIDVTGVATYTILNDDTAAVTIADVNGNENDGAITVTATLNNAVDGGFTVDVGTTDDSATTSDNDYTAVTSETLTFVGTAGETQTFTITPIADTKLEADERLFIGISNLQATTLTVAINDGASATILNDDTASVTIADVSANENDGNITVTASLDNAVQGGFSVDVNSVDGTATTSDSDYTAVSSETLTFAGTAGEMQTFTIAPTADNKVEVDETLTIIQQNLDATTLEVVISDGATVTITNDDTTVVTIADVMANENAGSQMITATLSNPVQGGFALDVFTTDGTGTTADSDYSSTAGSTLTFVGTAGETQTLNLQGLGDTKVESDETFTIGMKNVGFTTVNTSNIDATDVATYTILNDDTATITIEDVTVNESDNTATIVATSSKEVQGGFTLHATTVNGTAVSGTDFTGISDQSVATFAGTSDETQNIVISITDDMIGETTESFTVQLSSVSGTSIVAASFDLTDTATITINDDDTPVVTTTDASLVAQLSATLAGEVTNSGGAVLDRGIVYAITETNNDPEIGGSGVTQDTNGTGLGVFSESITSLQPNTQYSYKAYATNSSGVGYGAVKTFTTPMLLIPTITFENIDKTYGDANFTLNATSNSAGTISYAIVGTANETSLSGTNNESVSLGNAATITLRASQVADNIYDATSKDITLTIGKATLSVTADDKSKEYGEANPALTVSYSGFKGSDVISDLYMVPTASTTATATTDVGAVAITAASGMDANYDFSYTAGTLTISKATLSVTADDKSKTYGDANPALTVSYSGFKGSDSETDLDTAPTASTTAITTTDVGTITITAADGVDNNYDFSYTAGTLTIGQKALTITADAKTKTYGDTDPALTYQATLLGTDTLTGSLSRASGENVGSYAISSTLDNTNYDITYVGADLEITKKAVTVTADAKTKVYGDADPALTYQVTLLGADTLTGSLNRVSGEAVGSYAINSGLSSNNYAITYVGANLEITKKAVTVTADAKTKIYGDADPALTYQVVLVGSDVLSGSLSRVAGEDVGSYAISSTLDNSNYTITYVSADLEITKKAVTITADAKTKIYGEADPALTYQVTLLGSDVLTGGLSRDTGESAGNYAINSTLDNTNYDITYVSADLEITKKAVTVTADAQTKVYGDADPTLSYQVVLLGSDVLSGALTREEGEDVGTYTIVSELTSGDYEITYVPADLVITKKAASIVAKDVEITFEEAETHTFQTDDYEVTGLVDGDVLDGELSREPGFIAGIVYPITIGTLSNDNYELSFTSASFTIKEKVKEYGFSPNNDGDNDTWQIREVEGNPDNSVKVFNRSGKLVFEKEGYDNGSNAWDGKASTITTNLKIPAGVYYYVIELRTQNKVISGWLYINY